MLLDKKVSSLVKNYPTKKEVKNRLASRTIYAEDDNFYIDTEQSIYIEDTESNYSSYTFTVYRTETDNTNYLENLVLSFPDDDHYQLTLIRYELTTQEKQDLENGIDVDLSNNVITTTPVDDSDFGVELSNKLILVEDGDCFTLIETTCSYGNHADGYYESGNECPGHHEEEIWTFCNDSGGGGGSGSSDGDTSGGYSSDGTIDTGTGGGGGGSGSGTGSSNTDDGSNIGDNCKGCGGNVITSPLPELEEEILEETPCEILNNKTVNDSSYMANFNNLLEPWRYTFPNESGFVVKKVNGLNTYSYLFANNKKSLTFPAGSLNYTHVHNNKPKENDAGEQYDAAVKILSPEDLKQLIGVCRRANMFYNLPETDSFGVMVSDEGIFCISIIDELSSAEIHTFLQNLGKFEKEYIRVGKKIATKYSELSENQRKEMLQKMFLKGLKKLGLENKIGLFEGEVTNVSGTDILNWTRKTLNDSEEIIPNPC